MNMTQEDWLVGAGGFAIGIVLGLMCVATGIF